MTLSSYLKPRGKRGIFQLRVPVPRAYQRLHGGPPVMTRSLGTSDRALAVKAALPILSEWQSAWVPVPPPKAATKTKGRDLLNTVVEIAYDQLLETLEKGRLSWPNDAAGYDEKIAQRERELQRLIRQRQTGDLSQWEELGDRLIAKRGIEIDRSNGDYNRFTDALAETTIDAMTTFHRESKGGFNVEPQSNIVRKVKAVQTEIAPIGESLMDMYDIYSKWRSEPGRSRRRRIETLDQDRVAIKLFSEFVGYDRKISSITRDEAKSFRSILSTFPSSRVKNLRLANCSIEDCIKISKLEGIPTLSLTTQSKYLSILSPFFRWLVKDSLVSVPINIFFDLHHNLERGMKRRPSFSAAQLTVLLHSPLFQKSSGDGGEHSVGVLRIRDWRYWIPLLCLFTGSRITEVAQLHVDDITVRDGVTMVYLSHDETKGQFVKSKKKRLAALHKMLLDVGFMEFWQAQTERAKMDGNNQIFPELVAGKRALLGDQPSKWFRLYLERIGIKNGADGIGSHSFRHTMADAMRGAGYMDIEFGQLVLGHSNNLTTADYGWVQQGTPERLLEMLNGAFEAEPYRNVDFKSLLANAA